MAGHNLESVIKDTGSCGRFQVRQMTAINSIRFVGYWGIIFMSFGNYNPGWRCKVALNATSVESSLNLTTEGSGSTSRPCSYPPSNSLNSTKNDTELYSLNCISDGSETESFSNRYSMDCEGFQSCPDVEFDPVVQTIVTEWGLACHRNWIVSTIISIVMVGFFFGCLCAGQVSEQFGRRISYYGHCGICSVFSFVAAFSVSWQMYTVCSFFVGMGAGGVLAVSLVYSFEFLDLRWRAILGGIPALNISGTCFALVVYLSPDWRQLNLILAIASALGLCSVFWTPESMRWLAVHGKIEEAKAVVKKIATTNRVPVPEDHVLEELFSKTALASGHGVRSVNGNAETKEQGATSLITQKTVRPSYLDLFREKTLRSITIRLSFIWICLLTVYFSLSFSVKSFQGNFFLNLFIYSVIEIPFVLLVGPLANRVGRKWTALGFLLLASIACIAVIVVNLTAPSENGTQGEVKGQGVALASLVLAALAKALVAAERCVLTIYTIELPPTSVRNLLFAFCLLVSRFGTVVAPFLVPERDTFHISFSIMAVLTLVAGAILFSLPETKGRPMVDTSMKEYSTEKNEKRDTDEI